MQSHRTVHRGNQRHFDVEDIHQNFLALAIDLVVAARAKEIEAVGCDPLHERIAAAGHDDDAVVGIRTDRMKQVNELFVREPVENQHAAIGVKRHLKHAGLRSGQAGVGKIVTIGIEVSHLISPCSRRAGCGSDISRRNHLQGEHRAILSGRRV